MGDNNTKSRELLNPGDRVIITSNTWPERRGLHATIVNPPADGTYPQPARDECIILIDDDPLQQEPKWWSCVLQMHDLVLAP